VAAGKTDGGDDDLEEDEESDEDCPSPRGW
jgi:hypothetical protein